VNNKLIKIFATGFGSGYFPVASGTAGSLVALALYGLIFYRHDTAFIITTFLLLPVSVYFCGAAEALFGKKDDSRIVLDEIVGQWVSIIFLPKSLALMILAFFIFRVFDVVKPFFRRVQNLPGGYGIVIDDVLAGMLTNLALRLLILVKII
jgi:phosphatidylglycerophosphatase A